MKAVRRLQLRREALIALDAGEARRVAGQAQPDLTPLCPVIFTLPVDRCLSIVVCTVTCPEPR